MAIDVDNEVKRHITNRIKNYFCSRSYRALAAKEAKQLARDWHLRIVDTLRNGSKPKSNNMRTVPKELWSSVLHYLKQPWAATADSPMILNSIFSYAAYHGYNILYSLITMIIAETNLSNDICLVSFLLQKNL